MTNILSLLLLIVSMTAGAVSARKREAVNPPRYVETRGLDGFRYWVIKSVVYNTEKALQEAGIDSAVCTFRQLQPAQDFSYRGTGKCLMKAFIKSMESNAYAGPIFVWIRDSEGRLHSTEIRWRPPRGGLMAFYRQLFEMKFESSLYWIRKKLASPGVADKMRYKEFILGDLEVFLPEDPRALRALAENGNIWVRKYSKQLDSFSLNMKPIEQQLGKMIYTGTLDMQMRSVETKDIGTTTLSFKTNMNVLISKRPFYLQAQAKTEGSEWLQMGVQP